MTTPLLGHQNKEFPISSCPDPWMDEFSLWYHSNSEMLEKRVRIFAIRYGIDEDDLFQDVVLKVMLRLRDGEHNDELSSLTTYTATHTIRGVTRNYQRRNARTDSHLDVDSYDERIGLPSDKSNETEQQVERREQRDMIDNALEQINQRYAQALKYKYLDDADNKEACEKLGVSNSLYRKHLERGRNSLKKVLDF